MARYFKFLLSSNNIPEDKILLFWKYELIFFKSKTFTYTSHMIFTGGGGSHNFWTQLGKTTAPKDTSFGDGTQPRLVQRRDFSKIPSTGGSKAIVLGIQNDRHWLNSLWQFCKKNIVLCNFWYFGFKLGGNGCKIICCIQFRKFLYFEQSASKISHRAEVHLPHNVSKKQSWAFINMIHLAILKNS